MSFAARQPVAMFEDYCAKPRIERCGVAQIRQLSIRLNKRFLRRIFREAAIVQNRGGIRYGNILQRAHQCCEGKFVALLYGLY
jgi:hypothetical protein